MAGTQMSEDRAHLEAMVTALDASPRALRRPICRGWVGDYEVAGKLGHVLADGDGFLLYAHTGHAEPRPRRWANVKRRLSFCRLTQDGDDEGCLHLDRLPTPAEAEAIRDALGIRRRRHLTPEARALLAQRLAAQARPLAVVSFVGRAAHG